MPFTLGGYTETQDSAGVLVNVAALADQHLTVAGDNIRVPALANLAAYYANGTTITLAQLSSPSLRRRTLQDIQPVDIGAEPASPPAHHDRFANPLPLEADEDLTALVAEAGAAAEYEHVLVWFSDGPIAPVTGEIFTVRATNTTTLVAYAWSNCALTFSQTLPKGSYQIVGARGQSAGALAFRFVFPGGTWRPGGLGCDAIGDHNPPGQRSGGWGVWGEFASTSPPTVDFLSVSADTSEIVHLDLIKIA